MLPKQFAKYRTLVLNSDYTPLSYRPLSLYNPEWAITAIFKDVVDLVAEYDVVLHSPSTTMKIPSIVRLRKYVPKKRRCACTRYNVLLRDDFTCQYCGTIVSMETSEMEHVFPESRGGKFEWTNIVTSCVACNTKKGNRTPKEANMTLRKPPFEPNPAYLYEKGRKFPPVSIHETWKDYLVYHDDPIHDKFSDEQDLKELEKRRM